MPRRTSRKPPAFDLTTVCPKCGYGIQPNELIRLHARAIQCCKCGGTFDPLAGVTVHSTS